MTDERSKPSLLDAFIDIWCCQRDGSPVEGVLRERVKQFLRDVVNSEKGEIRDEADR